MALNVSDDGKVKSGKRLVIRLHGGGLVYIRDFHGLVISDNIYIDSGTIYTGAKVTIQTPYHTYTPHGTWAYLRSEPVDGDRLAVTSGLFTVDGNYIVRSGESFDNDGKIKPLPPSEVIRIEGEKKRLEKTFDRPTPPATLHKIDGTTISGTLWIDDEKIYMILPPNGTALELDPADYDGLILP